MSDWDVGAYEAFADLRLRPIRDLLAQVPTLGAGEVVDLGCGAGAAAPALRTRFPDRRIIGVDASPGMLAAAAGRYDDLTECDIADWRPATAPALIFSNAALHWLDGHRALIPRLYGALAPAGALAMQMPGQLSRPSHTTMLDAAASVRPDLFTGWSPFPGPLPLAEYAALLPGADLVMWETIYHQRLAPPPSGHPVRAFSSSTAARPILARLTGAEAARFAAAWDLSLATAYPPDDDGGVWFPFLRVFVVARKSLGRPA